MEFQLRFLKMQLTFDGDMEPRSDLEIKIDFLEGQGSAARVFEMASSLIRSLEDLDRVLLESVDSRIETTLVIEDIRKSSLKVVLRNILRATEDDAIKGLDWKKLVGGFLLQGKYASLKWLDRHIEEGDDAHIEDLTDRIAKLAVKTDVRHLGDYAEIKPSRLAQALDEVQRTKGQFRPGEGLTITIGSDDIKVNVREHWLPSDHLPPEASEDLENTSDLVLIVKKPDLLGDSQWTFRHGKQTIVAVIQDMAWMNEFRLRRTALRPGDGLRVRVRMKFKYDGQGELVEQKAEIVKVYGVIDAPATDTKDMFKD